MLVTCGQPDGHDPAPLAPFGAIPTAHHAATIGPVEMTKDFSKTNPSLHRLYVIWAQYDLQIINNAIEQISEVSRIDMSILAGTLAEERAKIASDHASKCAACQPEPLQCAVL